MLITYIYTEHHIFRRGFTGHEHLGSFGIINMNGRIYDPNTASFFSPDPYVSSPYSTQAFNRYSYCVNNPLMYTDPSGEFLMAIINAVKDLFTNVTNQIIYSIMGEKYQWNWHNTKMAWEVDKGLFRGDFWQIISRWTIELPQTILGYVYSGARTFSGDVDRVESFDGATFVISERAGKNNGLSLGSYININDIGRVEGDFKDYILTNPLYMHEYGHYLQSQWYGLLYLPVIGIPSLVSAASSKEIDGDPFRRWTHAFFGPEMQANRWADVYFGSNYGVKWERQRYRKGVIKDYYPWERR